MLSQKPHSTFERKGSDLLAEIEITLVESLSGFSRVVIKHLDGRGIHIRHPQPAARVLVPDRILKIDGEGMPNKKSDLRGDVYLRCKSQFQEYETLQRNQAFGKLKELLPGPNKAIEADEVDDVDYDESADLDHFGGTEQQESWEDADGEDEEGPQCQQQ